MIRKTIVTTTGQKLANTLSDIFEDDAHVPALEIVETLLDDGWYIVRTESMQQREQLEAFVRNKIYPYQLDQDDNCI